MSDSNKTETEVMTPAVYGILAGVFVLVLTVFVLFSTGSIIAVFITWLLIALILVVLAYYGFIDLVQIMDSLFPDKKKKETKEEPAGVKNLLGAAILRPEVFHVSDNKFTYDEAPAVCAAYGARLATLEQIIEAYNNGAEWCNYGWSAGGMALYPTQQSTWSELQNEVDPGKRTRCGRPGVNGGYFEPTNKFGVNCMGVKPKGEFNPPAPLPGMDQTKFREMVDKFKNLMKSLSVSPYSRQEWSGVYGTQFQATQPTAPTTTTTEHFTEYADQFTENINRGSAYTASPLYLRGDQGPEGKQGPAGPSGTPGGIGPTGPAGPAGQGLPGEKGPKGDTGPKGDIGPKGDKGDKGADGKSIDWNTIPQAEKDKLKGGIGPKGDKGDKGEKGDKGDQGERGQVSTNDTNFINSVKSVVSGLLGDYAKKSDVTAPEKDAIVDTRSTNLTPGEYWKKGPGVYRELKQGSSIGSPAGNNGFGPLETTVPWYDPSGGNIIQEFKIAGSGDKPVVFTRQTQGDHYWDKPNVPTWGGWRIIRST